MKRSSTVGPIASKLGTELRPSSRRKHQAIVDAARQVFLEQGFASTTMDAIAASADVSKRTVYKHFDDKHALFAAVVKMLCDKVVPPTLDELDIEASEPVTVLVRLANQILSNIYASEQIALLRVVVTESQTFPELGSLMYEQVENTESLIRDYLLTQQKKGVINLPDADLAARQFIGLIKTDLQLQLLFGRRKRVHKSEIEKIAQTSVELFLNGAAVR
ncbi:MAG: TetR/AcrR family transcriptional regulator [Gammaproteobacteria bacterium]|jgi:AcrR family transcriptional regulator|nr:TetR/AcrR family transcriptional regulator [Gammaproteobacteria bacterium]MDP7270632.1 TetR/AcrR family transcriptional regulator [Gammaproteobacteria bacterium]HJP03740.1 TetR/AcrR family transcriptional regulator [Gammaproteobacteria bacterium]